MRTMRLAVVVGVLTVAAVLAGCGSDGEGPSIDVTLPQRTTTTPSGSTPTDPPTTEDEGEGQGQTPTTEDEGEGQTPTTEAPTTEAPTTEAPTTEAPTTEAPTTEAPTTEAPTTEPPTTEAPTTEPEATTTTEVDPDLAGATEESSDDPWWPWALAAAAVAGLVGLLLVRRSRGAAALRARTDRLLTEVAELATHLAGISAGSAQVVAAQDAARLASLGAELEAVAGEEPDQGRKAAVGRVRAQALVVHGVVDSVALSAVAPSDAAIGHLQEQATILHTEAARARAELFPTPQTPAGGTTR